MEGWVSKSQWVGTGGSALVGLISGYGVSRLGRRLGLHHLQSMASGLMAALLALVVAADLLVPMWGDWWAGRPMVAATVTGGLLLGLTVLFFDAVIEVRRGEAVRKLFSGRLTQTSHATLIGLTSAGQRIAATMRPRQVVGDSAIRWSEQRVLQEGLRDLVAAAQDFRTSVREIRSDLMHGGEQMHRVYIACWQVEPATRRVESAVSRLRSEHTALDDSLLQLGSGGDDARIGYIEWLWNEVGRAYNGLVEELRTFESQVDSLLRQSVRDEPVLRFELPQPLEGFPDPTHMYWMGSAPYPQAGAADQPSG